MNNTIKSIISLFLLTFTFAGCYDDKGNYEYISEDEAMPVHIAPIDSISIRAASTLSIKPELTGNDGGDYSYLWYAIDNNSNAIDTLSKERDLNVPVNMKVGKYRLYYRVYNNANGVYRSVSTPLNVTSTDITSGWYVMKKSSEGVDIDYYSIDGKYNQSDILDKILNAPLLKGEPKSIMWQPNGYGYEIQEPDGTITKVEDVSAMHLLTSNDYVTLSGADMSEMVNERSMFYESPDKIDFQLLFKDDYTCFMMNNGKIQELGGIGKWGYQMAGNYQLMPFIVDSRGDDFGFDNHTNTFYNFAWGDMSEVYDMDGNPFTEFADSAISVSRGLLHNVPDYLPDIFLIAKSGMTGKHYAINVQFAFGSVYKTEYYKIPSNSPILDADIMAMPKTATVIYYANENKLMMYRIADEGKTPSKQLKSFAQNEKIAFIKNITGTDKDGKAFNDIVIITNTPSEYNVYRFPMVGSAGELNTTSSAVISGKGEAHQLLFRQE